MQLPIETQTSAGQTIYAVIHHPDGRVWNFDSVAFEAFNAGHWTDYALQLTEQGATGYYRATYPSEIEDVLTTEALYIQAGGSPSIASDTPSGVGQSQGTNPFLLSGDRTALVNLKTAAGTELRGAAVSGSLTATQMPTDLTGAIDNAYNGRIVFFTTGALVNQGAKVVGYNGTTKVLTFTSVTGAPSPGDEFIIL